MDEICALFDPGLEKPLREVMFAEESALLDQTSYTQPALFTIEVALYRLVESFGLRPDYLMGHSVGEVIAAHLAGVLDLPDACTLVLARGRLMQTARPGGAMAAIQADEREVEEVLAAHGNAVSVAGVNGPTSVVIAGDEAVVTEVMATWRERGRKVKRLAISMASHSPHMDGVLDEFRQVASGLSFHPPQMPVVSNVTGVLATAEDLCSPGYWARHIRQPVRFLDSVRYLEGLGVGRWLEVGPDGVLTALVADCVTTPAQAATATLRSGRPEPQTFLAALATLYTTGVKVDWSACFTGGRRVDLPTYAFQHSRYWLDPFAGSSGATELGLDGTDHPILNAVLPVAGSDERLLTGRLSTKALPWLAASAVVPSPVLIELAIRAGDEVGYHQVAELAMTAPLVMPAREDLLIQVRVGQDGKFTFHARPDDVKTSWTEHARGLLSNDDSVSAVWPEGDGGPADADAELPASAEEAGFDLHPLLLEAALQAVYSSFPQRAGTPSVESCKGVRLLATGSTGLRVRVTPTGPETAAVHLADRAGLPVAVIEELTIGWITPAQVSSVQALRHDYLLQTRWLPIAPGGEAVRWGVLGQAIEPVQALLAIIEPVAGGGPESVHARVNAALEMVQRWEADDVRLVFVTSGAVAAGGSAVTDPGAGAIWGLLRSAQSESPNRFVLLDVDDVAALPDSVGAALATGEPQLAVRGAQILRPRLARVGLQNAAGAPIWSPHGTVLITGGTGTLGAQFARHLVTEQGVTRLLLTSRRGIEAPGATELVEELAALGATVSVAACDVSDRDSLSAMLAQVPAEHPVTGVVHTAGVIDDGVIAGMTSQRLSKVLRPKVDAAWHLHELTDGLTAFVLFSSLAGVIGGAGQSNYAAANAFLDALAEHRRGLGLAATSIAWGLWAEDSGITVNLSDDDRRRIARAGFPPIESSYGPLLFDRALRSPHPVVVATPLDLTALRSRPAQAPAVLGDLIKAPVRRVARNTDVPSGSLAQHLLGLGEAERHQAVLEVVLGAVSAVLGHGDGGAADLEQAFSDLGFDSLTAVEMRNRLSAETGVPLPPALIFDYPTLGELITYLLATLLNASGEQAAQGVDYQAEVRLPDDIQPAAEITAVVADPREVLLTGATGFLGAFLLRDLMSQTAARIHCLVRASDEVSALARLRESLDWYQVWDEIDPDRLSIVVGDLAEPGLGLAPGDFDRLAQDVDVIYHAGATVNWLRSYQELWAANVRGTQEILRMAARHRSVAVHYVSTVGVFAEPGPQGRPLAVTDPTGPPERLPSGYLRTKWVAEQIVDLARRRGMPVAVHRVDVISGDQRHGACQTRDFVWLSIKGLIQAGAVPDDLTGAFHLVPVDYASAGIIAVSRDPRAVGRTFHFYNESSLSLADMVGHLRSLGYPLAELGHQPWAAAIRADRDSALLPLLDAFELMLADSDSFYPPFDASGTAEILEGTGISCPPLTIELFEKYVGFFVDSGYLPSAKQVAAHDAS